MSQTTVFSAKEIITMNPSRPCATHVAVRDGRTINDGAGCYLHFPDLAGHVHVGETGR